MCWPAPAGLPFPTLSGFKTTRGIIGRRKKWSASWKRPWPVLLITYTTWPVRGMWTCGWPPTWSAFAKWRRPPAFAVGHSWVIINPGRPARDVISQKKHPVLRVFFLWRWRDIDVRSNYCRCRTLWIVGGDRSEKTGDESPGDRKGLPGQFDLSFSDQHAIFQYAGTVGDRWNSLCHRRGKAGSHGSVELLPGGVEK